MKDFVTLIIICAVGLIAMLIIVSAISAHQIRSFVSKIEEDERKQREEDEKELLKKEYDHDDLAESEH